MSINLLGAQYQNANTAGKTATKADQDTGDISPEQSVTEAFSSHITSAVGSLGELFAGGAHPEGMPTEVNTATAKGSGVPGRLGGLIPNFSVKPIGPVINTGVDKTAAVSKAVGQDLASTGKRVLESIRKL
jgi:hypothetical protein